MNKFSHFLQERLVQYNNGKKYGQVVFLAGGGGSGKGFAISNFLDLSSYKVIDVDKFKDAFLKLNQITHKYPEIADLNLSSPSDLNILHQFVKRTGIAKKQLDYLFDPSQGVGQLKNIVFDETGKDLETYSIVPRLLDMGYHPRDLHITWIFTNFREAVQNNIKRGAGGGRQVSDEILFKAHAGAAKTMYEIIFKNKLPAGVDGSITVTLNNKNETVVYTDANGNPIKDSKGNIIVKDFTYLTLKKPGRPIMSEKSLLDKFREWILNNSPDTSFID